MHAVRKRRWFFRVLAYVLKSLCLFLISLGEIFVLLLQGGLILLHHGVRFVVLLLPGLMLVLGIAELVQGYRFSKTVSAVLLLLGMSAACIPGPIFYYVFLCRRYPQLDTWYEHRLLQHLEALPNRLRAGVATSVPMLCGLI